MNKINSNIAEKIKNYKHYFIDLLILALPLLIGNLGHTLIGATDVFVVAKYKIDSLAAISIANSILFTIFIFGIGLICAVSIVLANKRGSRQKTKKYLLSTLIFSFVLAVFFSIICYCSKLLIPYMGFEEHLIPYIEEYITIVSFSMFGMFLYEGVKQFLQSYEIVNFPNLILLLAVFVNLIFDIILVFGFGSIPSMGSKGAAIATFSVRTLMGIIMFLYVFRFIDFKSKIDFSYMKSLIKIGYPIGAALLLEFLAFNIVTILVGRESALLAATHSILTTISSSTFMVPLAISTAVSVKVAYYYGAGKTEEIKRFSLAGLIMGVGFMALAGICFALFPKQLISLFTDNASVLNVALPIMMVVAMYQIFDGFQVVSGGILKGFKLTAFVSNAVFFGYWIVGMPVAVLLVYKYDMSLSGYWIALAVSLCVMGFVQAFMAKHKFNQVKEMYK